MSSQLALFEEESILKDRAAARSGAFVDNMSLPIHRWFRYSAGFSAQWVEDVLRKWKIGQGERVLDPFAGSGTVAIVCDQLGIPSFSLEAHPTVSRILRAKLGWGVEPAQVGRFADKVIKLAQESAQLNVPSQSLLERSFHPSHLRSMLALKTAWSELQDGSKASEIVWLILTAVLRQASSAGTAQWQYILPKKTKKKVLEPFFAFQQQLQIVKSDLRWMQSHSFRSMATAINGDARSFADMLSCQIDAVITSPPYANNYDYADALRFEMTFWGEVDGWRDIHEAVRKHLIVSSSQHSSRERLALGSILDMEVISPIRDELTDVTTALAEVRVHHGGKKQYHTMIAAYCRDIGLVLRQLRKVCKPAARMCWVIGDSAPYGVHCPVEKWIGELAISAGFTGYRFEKLRDRNIKWKNRKHRVPLHEGLLWIEG